MEAVSFNNLVPDTGHKSGVSQNWRLLPLYTLRLHTIPDPVRTSVEQFIYQRFAHQYGARISSFLPILLSAWGEKGINAALGFQPASIQPLFLEQYLDHDIETSLRLVTQINIRREQIVEIGNLASSRQKATQSLFLLLAQILYKADYEWVVFTANRAVRAWLLHLQIPVFELNEADPGRLPDKGVHWGSYYDDRPVVLAANIDRSFSTINATQPLMAHLHDSYAKQIIQFAVKLRQ